jgi:DNA repair exonuclease SbcCD ATPase subunit
MTAPATTTPRVLKFTLSLSNPDDLKVRQGDYVEVNQVLADRTRQQQALQTQQTRVQLSLQKIQSQQVLEPPPPAPIPPVKSLPVVTYGREEAAIATVQSNIDLQLRKLDLLTTMSPSEVPPAMREHEERVLESLYRELEAAEAALKESQEKRAYQEYEYSLSLVRRVEEENQQRLSYNEQLQRVEQQRREREFQIAQLETQLQDISRQLAELSTVRSPYSGTIRRVKWLGQSDNRLTVEITLAVGSRPGDSQQQPDQGGSVTRP